MDKCMMPGAAVERGRISAIASSDNDTVYTVESIDRPGAVTLTIPAMGDTLNVNDVVYFSLFQDGTGIILSGIGGRIVRATATEDRNGLMSAEDKVKLDNLAAANVWSLDAGEAIPENSDLDSYTTPGNYRCESGTIASTISHCPVGANPFVLKVFESQEAEVLVQWVIQGNCQRMYMRRYANNAFTDWVKYTTENATTIVAGLMSADDKTELDAFAESGLRAKTTTETNIDNISTPGIYWFSSVEVPSGTWPFDITSTGYGVLEVFLSRGVYIQRLTQFDSNSRNKVYIRMHANNRWYDWREVDTGPVFSFEYGTSIASNSDLNDYTTPGNYRVTQASVAATITNTPITSSGYILKVMEGSMDDVLLQIVIKSDGSQIYGRYKVGSVWGSWASFLTNVASTTIPGYMSAADKSAFDNSTVRGKGSTTETNLDNLKVSGTYWLSSTQTSGWPSQEPNNRNAVLDVFFDGGGARIQELTMYSGTGENNRYVRMFINNQWYAWRKIATGAGELELGQQITANANLNNYKTPGTYASPVNITPTLTNKPPVSSNAFVLKVMVGHVAGTVVQIAIDVVGTNIFVRYFNTSAWGSWYKYTGTAV